MPAGCSQLPNFRYATHSLITHTLITHTLTFLLTHTHTHHPPILTLLLTHPPHLTPSHSHTHPHPSSHSSLTHTYPHPPSPSSHPPTHTYPHTPLSPTHTLTHPHTPHTLHTLHTHTLTDLPLQLNHAKFEFNGATGYILKPWVMLTEKTRGGAFNPFTQSKLEDIVPAKLSIKVRHGLVVGGGL